MRQNNTLMVLVFLSVVIMIAAYVFHVTPLPPIAGVIFFYFFYPWREEQSVKKGFFIVGVLLLFWIWNELSTILTPFLISLFLAYLFDPLIDRMEKKIRRPFAVLIFMALSLALTGLLLVFIVPEAVDQMLQLLSHVSKNQNKLFDSFIRIREYIENIGIFDADKMNEAVNGFLTTITDQLMSLFKSFAGLFQSVFNIVIIPVITFYLLRDYDKIRLWAFSLFREKERKHVEKGYDRFNDVFGRYFRGVLLDSFIVGILTFVGMLIAGVPYALFIGIITMIFNLIPYVGIWIAFGLSVVFTLAGGGSFSKIIILALIYFSIQAVESSLIYPRVVGKSVGLYPIAVMVMLLILSHFMGIFGLFLGVPISAFAWYWLQERFGLGVENSRNGGKNE